MNPTHLKALNAARSRRCAAMLVTDLASGQDRLVVEGEDMDGPLGEAVAQHFLSGKAGLVEINNRHHFLNVYLPLPRVVVIGAVHISQALVPMAQLADFDVTIIDPRTAFATPERFADVELIADWPQDVLLQRPLDRYSALVAVTHDPKIDDPAIVAALNAHCFYVGALGSRKTHGKRVERLMTAGFGPEQIGAISAPIGLDIGAATPAEIAVAVLADIIRAFRRRTLATSTGDAA
ncbi:XdhC family protein [Rhizobium sp. 18065]|uniref:XdhC family protein n=1 Tax=Rhizobium sp. 18065 TaxID=2681411 RepID=UPI00135BD4C1|nr:XdhC family protein [Rhizobium sp. 18065]